MTKGIGLESIQPEGDEHGPVSIVVLTYNRRQEVLKTLTCLLAHTGRHDGAAARKAMPIIVVDNRSDDGTARAVAEQFPEVVVVTAPRNAGAAGRNLGVERVRTPYVAFTDDDTCWEPGAIWRAVDLLEQNREIAVVNARILVGEQGREDPTCGVMARSPLGDIAQGKLLLGFMAGACVMRTQAFRAVGGYWPPFFIGGEEELVALDFAARGWHMVYASDVVTRHFPSTYREAARRRQLLTRNAIWTAWMRLPLASAWRESLHALRALPTVGARCHALATALAGMPRALLARKPVPAAVLRMREAVRADTPPDAAP